MEYIVILARIAFFYMFIAIAYRFMGKREVGQLGVMDLIVSILIAELTALSIEDTAKPIMMTVLPITFLVLAQIIVAYLSLKSSKLRDMFDGKPSMIIEKGKLNFKEMIKQRYNLDDFLTQLREKGIKNIEDVEYAILENNGKLSIFKYPKDSILSYYPMPIILDGKIQHSTLEVINKNENWLNQLLEKENVSIDEIFYAFYKGNKTFIIKRSDIVN
jgi:uncharacterized membrane protein YcaP (DUF421 family)